MAKETLSFKVTIEYILPNMASPEELTEITPLELYQLCTDDFNDSVLNFSDEEIVTKVEIHDPSKPRPYTETKQFWERLKQFIEEVRVNDPMSEEEQSMILHQCNENINKFAV